MIRDPKMQANFLKWHGQSARHALEAREHAIYGDASATEHSRNNAEHISNCVSQLEEKHGSVLPGVP